MKSGYVVRRSSPVAQGASAEVDPLVRPKRSAAVLAWAWSDRAHRPGQAGFDLVPGSALPGWIGFVRLDWLAGPGLSHAPTIGRQDSAGETTKTGPFFPFVPTQRVVVASDRPAPSTGLARIEGPSASKRNG